MAGAFLCTNQSAQSIYHLFIVFLQHTHIGLGVNPMELFHAGSMFAYAIEIT